MQIRNGKGGGVRKLSVPKAEALLSALPHKRARGPSSHMGVDDHAVALVAAGRIAGS